MSSPPIKLIRTSQAAELLGMSVATLESWRLRGYGPRFAKTGRLVRYVESDVLVWIDAQMRVSTSQQVCQNAGL